MVIGNDNDSMLIYCHLFIISGKVTPMCELMPLDISPYYDLMTITPRPFPDHGSDFTPSINISDRSDSGVI